MGYRANSVYLSVVDAFLEGKITTTETEKLFKKGNLGEQCCLVSEKAFSQIAFAYSKQCRLQDIRSYDGIAKRKVFAFLQTRDREIASGKYTPSGLTIDDVTAHRYVFNRQTGYLERS